MRMVAPGSWLFILCVVAGLCRGQKVLYSPLIGYDPGTRFQVIGKAGDYYWIQKSKKRFSYNKVAEPWVDDKEVHFEIYDARMSFVRSLPADLSPGILKQYLIPGEAYFDELSFQPVSEKIIALVNRYTPDGDLAGTPDTIAEFPSAMKCGDFVLVRSQDKNRILLLGFETMPESPPALHAFLYDKNWAIIHHAEYNHANISKPLVQYDRIESPIEDFNSATIKLGNTGEWLMVVSSGTNHNYLLFHFNGTDDKFVYKEIKLLPSVTVEDAGLYLDNQKREGFAGIACRARATAVKTVRMVQYELNDFKIGFDTSYTFNTLAGNKLKNENMFEEYFMTVPSKGFLFLKEYGRTFSSEILDDDTPEDQFPVASKSAGTTTPENLNRDDYTRYDNLGGTRNNFDRGDLALYYFPARRGDSCWSGIINKEQITELGHSYLSYVFLPRQDKLFFLYNAPYRNGNQYSSATVLDAKGNSINEGVEYWKINNTLVFQKARQIAANELAIPYEKNMRNGFAIIKL